ncbi:hypothetical protein BKA70DRAFT_1218753 [Coprinopsis sp. MPI-PUGE-AT-0042]|nr:hypothetical protein BKA70DRAFT_1218753 [Coprinopsis sp. MPI-PUGE-AT-0042]
MQRRLSARKPPPNEAEAFDSFPTAALSASIRRVASTSLPPEGDGGQGESYGYRPAPHRHNQDGIDKENEDIPLPRLLHPKTPDRDTPLTLHANPPFRPRNGSTEILNGRVVYHQGKRVLRTKNSSSLSVSPRSRSTRSSPSRISNSASYHGSQKSTFYARYNSSSSSQLASGVFVPHSPTFTFGVPAPRQGSSGRGGGEMFFNHQDTPPPLPPLDHPAFQEASDLPSSKQRTFDRARALHASRSLPADVTSARRRTSSAPGPSSQSLGRKGRKLSLDRKAESRRGKDKEVPRRGHTRSESKSSIASSRRSSAEFSARNVSLLGLTEEYEDTWEVKVSKEILRLSLTPVVTGHSSARGRREGSSRNRLHLEGGEARGLGLPFLSDSPTPQSLFPQPPPSRGGYLRNFPSIEPGLSMSEGGSVAENVKSKGSSRSSSRRPARASSKSTPERTPSPGKIDTGATGNGSATTKLLVPPSLSFTGPTPEASPIVPVKRIHHKSTPTSTVPKSTPLTPPAIQKSQSTASGKRKAEDAGVEGVTPPREPRATFAPEPRTHRASATSTSSHAPVSYHRSKRARISLSSDSISKAGHASLLGESPNAKSTGSWSSRSSMRQGSQSQNPRSSRPPSTRPPSSRDAHGNPPSHTPRRSASRRSISNHSIPVSAYLSPHAPSVTPSGTFHMRDPRKPPRLQDTPWTLSVPTGDDTEQNRWSSKGWVERGGSPMHAWLFFIGFAIFPLWWVAGWIIPIPRTRRLEGGDAEKGVILDDPQVEHDYKSWRRRCRIMGGVAFITYIPFIILIAIFV